MTVTEITNKTHGCRKTRDCWICVPAHLSHTGKKRWERKPIDKCLFRLVDELNDKGILTANCCCGHGVAPGSIILHNGITLELSKCQTYPIRPPLTDRQIQKIKEYSAAGMTLDGIASYFGQNISTINQVLEVRKCKKYSKTFSIKGTLSGRQRCSQN